MLGEFERCKAAELAGNSGNTHCFGYIRPHSCVWTGSTLLPLCLSSLCICLVVLVCRAPFKCKTTQLLARPRRENSTLDEGREGQGDVET